MADLNSTLVRGNLRVTDEITTDNVTSPKVNLDNAYHRISKEDGTTVTRAYGGGQIAVPNSAGKGVAILAEEESSDYGLLYVGSDGALLSNSGDTGYVLRVNDKDTGSDILQVSQTGGTSNFYSDLSVAGSFSTGSSITEAGTTLANKYAGINHTHYYLVTEGDNRNVATEPNNYNNKFTFAGLKTNSYINNPSSDSYSYLFGLRGWSDSSGGNAYELAFNNTNIYFRSGATDSWGSWNSLVHSGNIGSQSVNYANSAGDADTVNGYDASDFVHSNSSITGATKCKITYDSKGLVTAGADLAASDIPDLSATYLPRVGGSLYPMTGSLYVKSVTSQSLGNSITSDGDIVIYGGGNSHRTFVDGSFALGDPNSIGISFIGRQAPEQGQLPTNATFYLPRAGGVLATQVWVENKGYTTDSVSGVNDGTNWTSITINGTTMNIPSGGSGSLTLDNVSDGTTRKLNQVTAATGKAKLGVLVAGAEPHQTGDGYLELSDTSLYQGTTTYFRDRIEYGGSTLAFPTSNGTLALTSDVKHVYRHTCLVYINYCAYKIIFDNTSNSSTSLYDIMKNADGQVLSNVYLIGEMLAITGVYQNGSYVQIDADHYYKNNSNYMLRAQWTNINVEFSSESIVEV